MFEHPIVAAIIAGIVLAIIVPIGVRLFNRVLRPDIRIVSVIEKGPTTRELGFTEPAIKITLANTSNKNIKIKDIRLMFCTNYGTSIAWEAPAGRSHRQLPMSLDSGTEEHWYIPAQKFSALLHSLHRPLRIARTELGTVTLYARCITGTDYVYKGPTFSFSTDPNSHWP